MEKRFIVMTYESAEGMSWLLATDSMDEARKAISHWIAAPERDEEDAAWIVEAEGFARGIPASA